MKYKTNEYNNPMWASKALTAGKPLVIALLLAFSPLAASAQKISLGSCSTRDGGQYKGEMVSGKPQGKGTTVYTNGDKIGRAHV